MPRSSALWITARVAASSIRPPKLLQPSPMADTRSPDRPRLRISMAPDSPDASRRQVRPRVARRQIVMSRATRSAAVAPGGRIEVEHWPRGHDAGRIDPPVAHVIVPLDVRKIHRPGDAWDLVDVARIRPQPRIVDDAAD